MNPAEIPDWLKAYGPLGVAIWMVIASVRAKTPDNPPKDDHVEKLADRVTALERDVAVLKDRSDR